MKTYTLIVFGRVQGVGFRYHVHKLAVELGLVGGIFRNQDDGSVYIAISGQEQALELFVDRVNHEKLGFANVASVKVDRSEKPILSTFKIQ
jgi:acylphosphatase